MRGERARTANKGSPQRGGARVLAQFTRYALANPHDAAVFDNDIARMDTDVPQEAGVRVQNNLHPAPALADLTDNALDLLACARG